jgi:hypothetical protein
MVGTPFIAPVAPAQRHRVLSLLDVATGDAEGEMSIVRHDGTEFSALINIAPILDSNGSLGVIVTDITQS